MLFFLYPVGSVGKHQIWYGLGVFRNLTLVAPPPLMLCMVEIESDAARSSRGRIQEIIVQDHRDPKSVQNQAQICCKSGPQTGFKVAQSGLKTQPRRIPNRGSARALSCAPTSLVLGPTEGHNWLLFCACRTAEQGLVHQSLGVNWKLKGRWLVGCLMTNRKLIISGLTGVVTAYN